MEKFQEKKFHFTFRGLLLICAHLLISSPSFYYLLAPTARIHCESFLNLTSSSKFLHSCFRREWRACEEWFLKYLKRSRHHFSHPFFFINSLFISHCLILIPSYRPYLSFIWIGGSFRPLKFESRPERKSDDDENCLSFLSAWKDKERRAIEIEARNADEAEIEAKNVIPPQQLKTISEYRNVMCDVTLNYYVILHVCVLSYFQHFSVSERESLI